jgi:hypothetical protein
MSTKNNSIANKKLNIKDLIANAERLKKRKEETKELRVKSLDGNIVIGKPDRQLILEAMDMKDEDGDLYLVYECVLEPNLKDKELQEAYGVNGYEIVDAIFEVGEISSISKEITKFAGYGDSVEEIKN